MYANSFISSDDKVGRQNGFSLRVTEELETTRVWLECYQYLKIYSIWGNETLAELKVDDAGKMLFINDVTQIKTGPKVRGL